MSVFESSLTAAVASGDLLPSSKSNIDALLAGTTSEVAAKAVGELLDAGAWDELNDRFFKTLAFGMGGLRGRTPRRGGSPDQGPQQTAAGLPAGVSCPSLHRQLGGFARKRQ